jgi:sortase A
VEQKWRGLAVGDPLPSGAGSSTAAGYLFDAVRIRPVGRAVLSTLAIALFLSGVGMFGYPLATDLYAQRLIQRPLIEQFGDPGLRVAFEQDVVPSGRPVTRLEIPSIGVDAIVVEGTTPAALRAGAGHYPETPLPGEDGNVAIAGHRTTYGKPFNRLDEVRPGELILLETPTQLLTYEVMAHEPGVTGCQSGACWITDPMDWRVVQPLQDSGPTLTLTTCHPKGSAAQRLVLRAALVALANRPMEAA